MGGGAFKPRRLAAAHEVWSIVERMSWSLYRDVVVQSGWVMKHFQWSREFAYIQGARSSEMLFGKHIEITDLFNIVHVRFVSLFYLILLKALRVKASA